MKRNQRRVMELVDRMDKLYERLQLNIHQKFQFIAENQGETQHFQLKITYIVVATKYLYLLS